MITFAKPQFPSQILRLDPQGVQLGKHQQAGQYAAQLQKKHEEKERLRLQKLQDEQRMLDEKRRIAKEESRKKDAEMSRLIVEKKRGEEELFLAQQTE